ncbi:hypothetical protein MSTE_03792 [Mycobacteroides stephanolepidis]|uniref:GAP family protein n=2 Tax=[Mycobacterium] stephanolepidis TaxID=1520670 RepID=A0A1Z4F1K6_9MYCO|nr:hypothetical protein MSTE_03792 [[Mycobacterium] stephanolepidis]
MFEDPFRRDTFALVTWSTMWGAILVLALLAAADPLRIGVALLLFSRPRPILNALAFWIGGLAMAFSLGILVLAVLRSYALGILHGITDIAATPPARYLQLSIGVLVLLMAARWTRRLRHSRKLSGKHIRTGGPLRGRSLWIAFAAGLGMATPWEYLAVLAAVLVSKATASAQIGAVLLFTCIAFTIVEIPLISYLFMPSGTREVMLRVHTWAEIYRRHTVVGIAAVVGGLLVTTAIIGI